MLGFAVAISVYYPAFAIPVITAVAVILMIKFILEMIP